MHTDFWSIFTAFALLLEIIPGLVVISLAWLTDKSGGEGRSSPWTKGNSGLL